MTAHASNRTVRDVDLRHDWVLWLEDQLAFRGLNPSAMFPLIIDQNTIRLDDVVFDQCSHCGQAIDATHSSVILDSSDEIDAPIVISGLARCDECGEQTAFRSIAQCHGRLCPDHLSVASAFVPARSSMWADRIHTSKDKTHKPFDLVSIARHLSSIDGESFGDRTQPAWRRFWSRISRPHVFAVGVFLAGVWLGWRAQSGEGVFTSTPGLVAAAYMGYEYLKIWASSARKLENVPPDRQESTT